MTDILLEWMSFRGSGKLGDVGTDLTSDSPSSWTISDLVTLGHAEWTGPKAWRIAPPVLAGLPRGNANYAAVLCGARTPKLLSDLQSAVDWAGASFMADPRSDRPSKVMIVAESPRILATLAERAGIPLQIDAALKMLACAPSIRSWPRTPCPMVKGRVETVRRFSKSRLRWVGSTLAEATAARAGFFRIQRDWDWVSIIKSGPDECAFIDDRVGRMAAVARSKVVRWSSDDRTLALPGQLFPPTVLARGLALCSGELPAFDAATRHITFTGVTPGLLRITLTLMGLRLA